MFYLLFMQTVKETLNYLYLKGNIYKLSRQFRSILCGNKILWF